MIRKFSKAADKLIDRVEAPADDVLTDEVDLETDVAVPPSKAPINDILQFRPDNLALEKRSVQLSHKINEIEESTLFSAVKNNEACNLILRDSASTLSKTLQM